MKFHRFSEWILVLAATLFFSTACGRAPIPTSEQPRFVTSVAPTIAALVAPALESDSTPESGPTATPEPAIALPISTRTPPLLPTITQAPIAYDRNPRALLIEADVTGSSGSVPREMHLPIFRLYADGFVVRAGERAALATGFDSEVRIGKLAESEIQSILGYMVEAGFFSLSAYYEPRPAPPDLPTAHISVFLERAKTVTVYGPGFPGTPQLFLDIFSRITRALPPDDKAYVPTEGYLSATPAGSTNEVRSVGEIAEWSGNSAPSLAGTIDGVTISGNAFGSAAEIVAKSPKMLFREGSQVYRVRFAANVARSVHLTDWVGTILQGVREFEGRAFDIVGYYRGANLLGEARGNPPSSNAWVIRDETGAMYVGGAIPQLDPNSRADIWNVVRIRAVVVYIRGGTSYLEARSATIQ